MPLQAMQIVSLATQIAGVTGFTQQAGQQLNMILSDLCETYDFDLTKKVTTFPLNLGTGPYPLPVDYLRAPKKGVFFTFGGVPYPLTPDELSTFDAFPLLVGSSATPGAYATDLSQSPPVMYVWPASSSSLPLTVRYFSQMPDITQPETSTVVPWFPNQDYLVTRLAGELMRIADDDRYEKFLGDEPSGAQGILKRYLGLKDDRESRAQTVTLDRRFFRPRPGSLKSAKNIGDL